MAILTESNTLKITSSEGKSSVDIMDTIVFQKINHLMSIPFKNWKDHQIPGP